MRKDLTAIRFRPSQIAGLKKLAAQDKETSISSLVRRAVDEFLEKHKGRRKGKS
jgi:hypothetical protein